MTEDSEIILKVDIFPTVEEIIKHSPLTRCDECGRNFQNAPACRFHQLKQHLSLNVSNTNERRIYKRMSSEPKVTMAYHCPDPLCSSSKAWFEGIRNLKQHYFRAHTEKKLVCEKCGYRAALEKDLKYHTKTRCPMREEKIRKMEETKKLEKCKEERKTKRGKASDETPNGTRSKKNRKRSKSSSDDSVNEEDETFLTTSSQPSTSSASAQNVIQPIFLVVTSDNVHSVVDTIRKTLNCENPADISLNDIATDIPDSNTRMDFGNQESIPMIPPTSTSFATQYDIEPATYCERGTMMNGEPLDYFDPPYGAEFGDLTPRQKNEPFDYAEPSASQPQTRSFGTMFENVTTCNTGTSMIDESYVSEFLRDIETQTPSFMISQRDDQQHAPQSSDDWSWRLTDTDI